MELHQLRYIVEVGDRHSFTAAADHLHVSQSGVSAQVAKLERELGVRLFVRGARAATPTADGAALLPHARAALAAIGRLRAAADEITGLQQGRVRVGTVIGCVIDGYFEALAEFRSNHPAITCSAVEGNSDDLAAALLDDDLDVALLAHAGPLPESLEVHTVIDEPITAGVAPQHRLSARSELSVRDLSAPDLLTLPTGTGVRSALDQMYAAAGIDVVPAVEAFSPAAVVALAVRGTGVAVLTTTMLADAALVRVPIKDAPRTRLSVATRRECGTAARAFATTLRERLTPDSAPMKSSKRDV